MKTLHSEEEYEVALEDLNTLMKKGEENISDAEADEIEALALAIQAYEDIYYPLPMFQSVPEMVEQKRFELNLT